MPVAARILEERGLATVIVTPMPDLCDTVGGVPRTLGVEHPFGSPMGPAGDSETQRAVFWQALCLFERAEEPNYVEHYDQPYPDPEAGMDWWPEVPSPIVEYLEEEGVLGQSPEVIRETLVELSDLEIPETT